MMSPRIKIPSRFLIAVSVIVLHFCPVSKAETDFGAVSGATGRAGVAANDNGEQVFMNPAAMVHAAKFVSSYFYRGGYAERSERNRWNALTLIDNGDDIVMTGGFMYAENTRSFFTVPDYEERKIQLSLASFVYEQISFGMSVYNIRRDVEGDQEYEFYDGDIGLMWNPKPDFAIGARYDNWAKHGENVPDHVKLKDRLTLGVNYVVIERVRARLDLSQQMEANPNHRADFRAGLESFFDAFFVLRLGYERDQLADRKYYSAGLGFTGPMLRVDYAYRKTEDFSGGALHSVDFRLPF